MYKTGGRRRYNVATNLTTVILLHPQNTAKTTASPKYLVLRTSSISTFSNKHTHTHPRSKKNLSNFQLKYMFKLIK